MNCVMNKKNVFVMSAVAVVMAACSTGPRFEVAGEVTGAEGKTLYLEASALTGIVPLDSVKLKADGMLVHLAGEVYQLPCEQLEFAAAGSLLMHAGLRPPQRFCGTGYTEGVRPMPDFSARIWMLEAREVAEPAPDMI